MYRLFLYPTHQPIMGELWEYTEKNVSIQSGIAAFQNIYVLYAEKYRYENPQWDDYLRFGSGRKNCRTRRSVLR